MRNALWKISVMALAVFLVRSISLAQGLNGFFDINNNSTIQYEDGERTASSDTFNRNLYLNLQEPITPVLSYQFNLRTNFLDSETTDETDETTTRYTRSLEPALDLILGNPIYSLSAGVRRREQWNAAHMNNDNRRTNDYYYSRLSLAPEALPTLTLQLDKQRNIDYVSPQLVDDSNSVYSVNSAYDLPPGDAKLGYTVNYSNTINHTPLSLTNKIKGDNFNGTYNVGYAGRFLRNKADYSVGYQGNYSRNKTVQFVTQTGTVLNERIPFAGLYVLDVPPLDPAVGELNTENNLINNDVNTAIANINIGTVTDHNIGIWVSPENSVDRLFIYVDRDVSRDAILRNVLNWKVFKSNSNTPLSTWTEVAVSQVTIFTDTFNNIFRYELKFSAPQSASYFKAVNLETVGAAGLTDVFVTEIEALGTDLAEEDRLVAVTNSLSQQLSFVTNFRPTGKLTLSLNYTIDRLDQNPVSLMDSVAGVFENIYSDSITNDKGNFISNISRGYSAGASWLTHRLLTTTFRAQRSESFDNIEETDVQSNTYNLSFLTEPIPALNANLSLIRSDSFSFSEKVSANDSLLLSVGSRLYRDVNMITDIVYTRARSLESETASASRQINGTLDALLTRKLSGTLTYNYSRTLSEDAASESKEGSVFITYRPGKLINVSGSFKITDADGETSTAEGILLDWLPLQALRLNANYQHSNTEPGPIKSDTANGYIIWYVTKFADVRLTGSYSRQVEDIKTVSYSTSTSLNCRF